MLLFLLLLPCFVDIASAATAVFAATDAVDVDATAAAAAAASV